MSGPRPKVNPRVWQPPPAPARAKRKASDPPLPRLTTLDVGGVGPEDVVVDGEGLVFAGVEDGRVLRVHPESGRIETVADTGGRPMGIELLDDGLVVCDAERGLLRVDPSSGASEVLCSTAAGTPFRFCNNATVARDGTVYFTDSSQHFGVAHFSGDFFEHSGTGRLLRRDPGGQVEVLLDGMDFANGVALAADESFLAVAETGGYRIQRLWLTGERAGTFDVLADNLPGFPDNLARGTDGLLWVALASPRNPLLDLLLPRPPVLRRAVWAIPERLQPVAKTVWVMAFDDDGHVVHDLQRKDRAFHFTTGVRQAAGRVYLGSLFGTAIAWFDLPDSA
jgi:sugar lactone lactonase YvrE